MKLKALNAIDFGDRLITPGGIFDVENKEGQRLVDAGAAEVHGGKVEAKAEIQLDGEFTELADKLKVSELKRGLSHLQIDFDAAAKRPELLQAFVEACNANPIQASLFFDELNG